MVVGVTVSWPKLWDLGKASWDLSSGDSNQRQEGTDRLGNARLPRAGPSAGMGLGRRRVICSFQLQAIQGNDSTSSLSALGKSPRTSAIESRLIPSDQLKGCS